jgi:hypothetical protein
VSEKFDLMKTVEDNRRKIKVLELNEEQSLNSYNRMMNKKNDLMETLEEYKKKLNILETKEQKKINFYKEMMNEIKGLLEDKQKSYKWLTGMMADYMTIAEDKYQKSLEDGGNKHDLVRSFKINNLKHEKKQLIQENKMLRYELDYIKTLIPETEDIVEYDESGENYEDYENEEWIYKYLPKEEYELLTDIEKNERALEYYKNRKKSKWEIGRDFERYVGYLWEKKGYNVEYYGIEKKLKDLGRDLIIENNDDVFIVQCKYWSSKKLIHEKHIAQLFGTLVKYKIEHPEEKRTITGLLVTHTKLSDEARQFAEALKIIIQEDVELGDYPLIKCNVGRDEYGSPTRIYHLPMDLQYDKVKINKKEGDFYAFTIEEAESGDFRRAYKWHGNN